MGITEKIQIKKPLNEGQKDELLKQICRDYDEIDRLKADLKEYTEDIKGQIEEKQDDVRMSLGTYKQGGIFENVECFVKYENGKTQYISVATGEVVDEHSTTDEEQLRLNSNAVDAEVIIRADSEKD